MARLTQDAVLEATTRFYLGSHDFNGMLASTLVAELGVEWKEVREILLEPIEEDRLGVLYGDADINPHIVRLGFQPKEEQIAKLGTSDLFHTCIYPRPKHLNAVVDRSQHAGKPYTLCLALGEPQLAYRSFDLSVLEFYRNDPRYLYQNDDISGHISVRSAYYQTDQMAEHDQVLLESFGFSYDENLFRAVAVFLRYLADLSPEHQQLWKAKELAGDYRLHRDYFRNSIMGDWGTRLPIFSALLEELYAINRMAEAMARPPLFRQDFGKYGEQKPEKFGFLVRPTLEEFNSFVLLLDKMLSDNIDKAFFCHEVPYETERQRTDGRIQVQSRGTLQILDEWARRYLRMVDSRPWNEGVKALRETRQLRQRPAHAVDENVFDQQYFRKQRDLIVGAYSALRTLRELLAEDPAVRAAGIDISDCLREGRIWTY